MLAPSESPGVTVLVLVTKTFVLYVVSVLLLAVSIAMLMPMYGAARDFRRAITLAGFGATPLLVCGLLTIYPLLSVVLVIALPLAGYQLHLGAQLVGRIRPGDAAEFVAASMVLAALGSVVAGGALSAIGWL